MNGYMVLKGGSDCFCLLCLYGVLPAAALMYGSFFEATVIAILAWSLESLISLADVAFVVGNGRRDKNVHVEDDGSFLLLCKLDRR